MLFILISLFIYLFIYLFILQAENLLLDQNLNIKIAGKHLQGCETFAKPKDHKLQLELHWEGFEKLISLNESTAQKLSFTV